MVRKVVIAVTLAVALAAVCLFGATAWIDWKTATYRHAGAEAVPPAPVAIVFGAGLEPSGAPSGMLADRLDAAASLYERGTVRKLLLSGDNSRTDYDEVGSMQTYAVRLGVRPADIVLDHAGFDTYDTCYRAKAIFGVTAAVVITQRYHLARALYVCRALGIDATGYGTADWGKYGVGMMLSYSAREWLADVRALLDVHVTRRQPRFLGPFIGLR